MRAHHELEALLIGDFLLVDKLTYGAKVPFADWRLPGFRDPRRGDIIVFKDPRTNRDYIKRCIATDGETIEIKHNEVYIDGQVLPEPYKALKRVRGPQLLEVARSPMRAICWPRPGTGGGSRRPGPCGSPTRG